MKGETCTNRNQRIVETGLIKSATLVVLARQTVNAVLEMLLHTKRTKQPAYLYVVNDETQFQGVLALHSLLQPHDDALTIDAILEPKRVVLTEDTTVGAACKLFRDHRFRALPVLDADGKLVGVVDLMDLFSGFELEDYDQAFQLAGVHADQSRNSGPFAKYRDRMPWLLPVVFGGLMCACVASRFEELLRERVVIALFMALVLALSESINIQSLTETLRTISLNGSIIKIPFRKRLREEGLTGILLGATCGAIVSVFVIVWKGDLWAALVIAVSITACATVSCVLGMCIPELVHRMKRDSEVAGGPLSLTLTDILTVFFYLMLAALLLL